MKKDNLKTDINHIRNISAKMPKTINEAINFEGTDDLDTMDNEPIEDEPVDTTPEEAPIEKHEDSSMDVMAFVDDIRKKSLKGMAQLADNPDDERYQLLKKIWQICDKKPEQQTAFSAPGQKPQPTQNSMM